MIIFRIATMNTFFQLSILLSVFISSASTTATEVKCSSEVTDVVGRYLRIDDFSATSPQGQGGRIVAESCKQWPDDANIFLAAFAYNPDPGRDGNAESEKNLVVAVVDKARKRVLQSYQSVIQEDSITEVGASSLRLDTARYWLSKNVRAFGLVFNSSARGASCGEANWNNELTLFVPDGKKLRDVFHLFLFRQKSIKGCLSTQWPGAVWETSDLSVGMEKSQSNGYADLLVTARISSDKNDESTVAAKGRIERFLIRYDGKSYLGGANAPWWLGH